MAYPAAFEDLLTNDPAN